MLLQLLAPFFRLLRRPDLPLTCRHPVSASINICLGLCSTNLARRGSLLLSGCLLLSLPLKLLLLKLQLGLRLKFVSCVFELIFLGVLILILIIVVLLFFLIAIVLRVHRYAIVIGHL
mmetsp:Transcript_16408/g.20789  ORF Transcript_16408/g.20789 Transcript_16408/m.20789 type:complete len:118 (-) Transcript_16408:119-472(-)